MLLRAAPQEHRDGDDDEGCAGTAEHQSTAQLDRPPPGRRKESTITTSTAGSTNWAV
jgi:hypothetical protein